MSLTLHPRDSGHRRPRLITVTAGAIVIVAISAGLALSGAFRSSNQPSRELHRGESKIFQGVSVGDTITCRDGEFLATATVERQANTGQDVLAAGGSEKLSLELSPLTRGTVNATCY